jgi:2-hydroxychromene-2-carboxylate isomerase
VSHADINFYFDPLCPFAWMTSKWVRNVAAQRGYTVDWRFISLRIINADVESIRSVTSVRAVSTNLSA